MSESNACAPRTRAKIAVERRTAASASPRGMFSLLYGIYEYLQRKAEVRLLLVGLDKAGKTSCLEKLRALQLPGSSGAVVLPVAPTVGLNIARFDWQGTHKLVLWDLGGQACPPFARPASLPPAHAPAKTGLRSIWEKYYGDAHVLVFVVDAAAPERWEEARGVLERALASSELGGAPLLLLVNKKDLAGAEGCAQAVAALGPLGVESEEGRGGGEGRAVRVSAVCALSGESLKESLGWAVEAARKARRTRLMAERAQAAMGGA